MCCNGLKNAAPQLHAVAFTWLSYVELPVQRIFFGIAADLGNTIYGDDATNAYAHAPALNDTFLTAVDNVYMDWFKMRFSGRPISRKYVLSVHHALQGHQEIGEMWMHFIDNILINQMSFKNTTHDRCIYRKVINNEVVYILCQIDDYFPQVKKRRNS